MFRIGDRVVYVTPPRKVNGHTVTIPGTINPGHTGEIIDGPHPDPIHPDVTRYGVRFDGGLILDPIQECLRLIEPPKQELGSWAEIQISTKWNPIKVREPIRI